MDALIVKGDTVDEAIAHALRVLQAKEDEIAVQVIDWGEPGVLGISQRPAAVRVVRKENTGQETAKPCVLGDWGSLHKGRIEITAARRTAYAAICNGQLLVRHTEEGPFPTIVPCPGVEVRLNGQLLQKPAQVTMADQVTIKTLQEEIAGKWSIELTEDEVLAVIKLQPRVIRTYKLCDLPPSGTLRLQVEKEEHLFPPLLFAELVAELKRLGIKKGIDWDCCRRVTEEPISGQVVIARGVPPTSSQDGYLELFCLTEPRYAVAMSDDADRVDFRERFNINSVVKGAVLARKHPPVLGQSGVSVRGNAVLPKPPADVVLRLGKGVEFYNGTDIIAVTPGRPVVRERGRSVFISVEPVLVHQGNVDLESGNISFSGHIRVLGDVQDGMLVHANEDVLVQGLVSAAAVQAGGSAYIWGNVISSTIVAGGPLAVVGRFLDVLDALAVELEKLVMYVEQLRQHGIRGPSNQVIQVLLRHKCQAIPRLCKDFLQMVEQLPPRLNTQALERFAQQLAAGIGAGKGVVMQEIEELLTRCKEWRTAIAGTSSSRGDVQVNNLLNSSITATGNVMILGQCNDHSQVQAGGSVTVRGAYRGGSIAANGTVMVGELGTPVGTYTTVNVSADALVKVGLLHENVLITVGKRAYSSNREERDVQFYYDAKEDTVVKTYSLFNAKR